jgi:hypothetical protein
MRKTIVATTLALAAFSVGSEARAAGWGLHSGDTLGPGQNMLYTELGWPDFSVGFQHAVSPRFDVGFRFGVNYGFDYTTGTQAGMTMKVPLRFSLAKNNRYSVLFHFDPGLHFDSFGNQECFFHGHSCYNDGRLAFGFALGIGLEVGLHVSREATVNFGFEMPIFLNLTNVVYGAVPLLFGPGFEYQIDDHIALGINTRFGPTLFSNDNGNDARFALIAQGFFAYRL